MTFVDSRWRPRARAFYVTCAVIAALWTIFVLTSGGFAMQIRGKEVFDSHKAVIPAVVALVCLLTAIAIDRNGWIGDLSRLPRRIDRASPWLASALTLAALGVGLEYGTFVAGGADSFGYVSQAELWMRGTVTVDEPLARRAPWRYAAMTFTPLGFRPTETVGTIVPTYPPGLPLTMALAAQIGGRTAIFIVVPVLGAWLVWLTYRLGRTLATPTVGLIAAALLLASPVFLQQVIQPMSDIPVASWWIASLLLASRRTRAAAVTSGLTAAIAILTRPNLAPLAIAPFCTLLMSRASGIRAVTATAETAGAGDVELAVRGETPASTETGDAPGSQGATSEHIGPYVSEEQRREARCSAGRMPAEFHHGLLAPTGISRAAPSSPAVALAYALGIAPGVIAVAGINTVLYGSPLQSGYGSLADLYVWANVPVNAGRYAAWAYAALSVLPVAAIFGPWSLSTLRAGRQPPRGLLFGGLVLLLLLAASYLPYAVFEEWGYLRFFLPGLPIVLVLAAATLVRLSARLRWMGVLALLFLCAGLAGRYVRFADREGVFTFKVLEARYERAGLLARQVVPANGVLLAVQHSGAGRLYGQRLTIRWDFIERRGLDQALTWLTAEGRPPFILLEDWEEDEFRTRFSDASTIGALDWPPAGEVLGRGVVRLYDPADRGRYVAGARIKTLQLFAR